MHRDMSSAGGSWGAGDREPQEGQEEEGPERQAEAGWHGMCTPGGWPRVGLAKDMSAWGCRTFHLGLHVWKWFASLSPPLPHHSGMHDPIINIKEGSASSTRVVKGYKTKTRLEAGV